jgi:hypothetical protein
MLFRKKILLVAALSFPSVNNTDDVLAILKRNIIFGQNTFQDLFQMKERLYPVGITVLALSPNPRRLRTMDNRIQ